MNWSEAQTHTQLHAETHRHTNTQAQAQTHTHTHTHARYTPVNPGVSAASLFATSSFIFSSSILMGLRCTLKIELRPLMSGRSMWICTGRQGQLCE